MDAHDLLVRNRPQREGVVVSQVVGRGEGQFPDVVQGPHVFGADSRGVQAGPVEWRSLPGVPHGPLQARELMGREFFLRRERRHEGQSAHVGLLQSDVGESSGPQTALGRVVPRGRPQKGATQLRVHEQFVALSRVDDPTVGQQIGRGGGAEGARCVLLHQEDRRPRPGEAMNDVEDLICDQGREAQAGLVQEEQARARHEGPPDGHHLLLAPRERGRGLRGPLAKLREPPEDLLDPTPQLGLAGLSGHGPQHEVLPHAEVAEHLPPFRGQGHPERGHARGRLPRDVLSRKQDAPAGRRDDARNGLQEARLSRTVGSHDRHRLPLGDVEVDAEEGLGGAVVERQTLDV